MTVAAETVGVDDELFIAGAETALEPAGGVQYEVGAAEDRGHHRVGAFGRGLRVGQLGCGKRSAAAQRYAEPARELAGRSRERVSLAAEATVADAVLEIERTFPRLREHMKSFRVAVNEEFADTDARLSDQAVVAVIPPVSGG